MCLCGVQRISLGARAQRCPSPVLTFSVQTSGPLGVGVQSGYFLLMRVTDDDVIEDSGKAALARVPMLHSVVRCRAAERLASKQLLAASGELAPALLGWIKAAPLGVIVL